MNTMASPFILLVFKTVDIQLVQINEGTARPCISPVTGPDERKGVRRSTGRNFDWQRLVICLAFVITDCYFVFL